MTSKIIFDSSAILALINMEKGHEIVAKHLDLAIVSTVNFCEVITVLARKGFRQDQIIKSLRQTFLHLEDFDINQAIIAANLDKNTKNHGLSFGDRACLALAKSKNLPVLTADKAWIKLKLEIKINLIRV